MAQPMAVEDGLHLSYLRSAVVDAKQYAKLCDLILVVQGTELPCHSHVLAKESKVIFDLCCAQSEGHVHAAKRLRLSEPEGAVPAMPREEAAAATPAGAAALPRAATPTVSAAAEADAAVPGAAAATPAGAAAAAAATPAGAAAAGANNSSGGGGAGAAGGAGCVMMVISPVPGASPHPCMRLEEPFKDYTVEEVTLVLGVIYDPYSAPVIFKDVVDGRKWELLGKVLKIADFLEAPRLVACADGAVSSALPPSCENVDEWAPMLVLADRHPQQLVATYTRSLRLAVAALSTTVGDIGKAAAPGQKVLAHHAMRGLSADTVWSIQQGFLYCTHARLQAIRAGRPLTLGQISEACQTCNLGLPPIPGERGLYTWQWQPGFSISDPQAKTESASEEFVALGLKWQLFAYLNGFQAENSGFLSLYLRARPTHSQDRPARTVTYKFTIRGKPDVALQGTALVGENGAGFPRMMPTKELEDKSKCYMKDGLMLITVELSDMRNLDL